MACILVTFGLIYLGWSLVRCALPDDDLAKTARLGIVGAILTLAGLFTGLTWGFGF